MLILEELLAQIWKFIPKYLIYLDLKKFLILEKKS